MLKIVRPSCCKCPWAINHGFHDQVTTLPKLNYALHINEVKGNTALIKQIVRDEPHMTYKGEMITDEIIHKYEELMRDAILHKENVMFKTQGVAYCTDSYD